VAKKQERKGTKQPSRDGFSPLAVYGSCRRFLGEPVRGEQSWLERKPAAGGDEGVRSCRRTRGVSTAGPAVSAVLASAEPQGK